MSNHVVGRLVACLLVSAAALAGRSAGGEPPPAESTGAILLRHCVLECDQSTLLSAPFPSILQERLVRHGDRVKAGQVLGRLFDQVTRAELEMNAEEAESDVPIELSKADLAQANLRLKKSESLGRRQYVSAEDLLSDRFAVEKATLAVKQAEQRQRIARINRRRAEAELRYREFVSPHDGVVVAVYKNEGESVILHDPVFKVVNNERLRVWGALNVTDLWKVRVGQEVCVRGEVAGVDLPVEHQDFFGQITFIDTQIDQETQTCKVLAQIDNAEGQLRAGLEATMEILPQKPARTSTSRLDRLQPRTQSSDQADRGDPATQKVADGRLTARTPKPEDVATPSP